MNTKPTLAVGSIALDTLETGAGQKTDLLGGSATFFAMAAALFAPVRLVGVVGTDYPDAGWRLFHEKGIDVSDVVQVEGPTFRWGARYSADLSSRETLFTELGVFEHFKPQISKANQQTPFVYLGNIQPSLQLAVHEKMAAAEIFIADTMNLWIDLFPKELEQVLAKTDIFLLNDEEAVQYTGETDLNSAARALLAAGPGTVIIKQGRAGALLVTEQIHRHIPICPDDGAVDPTGAGDSFAGGLVAHLAVNGLDQIERAVVMATATASFTIEGFGLEGILRATADDVLRRADVLTSLMD